MPIERVIKRDNSIVPFDRKRIENAIYAAARAVGNGEGRQWAETLSWAVSGILEERFGSGERPPHVEEIQDIVEEVLIKSGNPRVAKAYILYRQRRAETRETQRMLLDGIKLVEDYLQRADWRVNENSNMNYSLQGLNFYIASSIAASYWLQKVYPPEVQKAHTEGDFHIHDLGMLSTYTYYGKEVVLVKDDSGIQLTSFEKLYADSKEPEVALNEADGAFAKYPRNCFVLDKSGWTRVVRLIRKRRDRPMRFIKNRGGRSVIVTDNHPMLAQNGERVAADVVTDQDTLYTVDPRPLLAHEQLFFETEIDLLAELKQAHVTQFGRDHIYFNGVPIEEIDTACTDGGLLHTFTQNITRKIPLTAEVGYLVGFILAEGYLSYNARSSRTISVTQKDATILHTINRTLIALGAPGCVSVRPNTGIYELQVKNVFLRFLFEHIFRIAPGARHKTLPVHVLRYNLDFVQGLLAGIIDGDGSIDGNGTCMMIRISARTLLEQMAYLLQLLGATPRDRNIEGAGTRRVYKGREIIQRFPLYGLSFRKTAGLNLPSTKFQNTDLSAHAWQDETRDEWHIVVCNQQAEIPDHDIYDITTESGTLIVNGMWNHNCCGWDLQELLRVGFGGVPAKLESAPPKHLRTALGQLVNFFYTLQGESAGAQAVSSFDTLLAPFIRYDGLDYKAVKQAMQEFIFNINVPTRVGFQTPFTNITLDLSPSPLLRDQPVIIGGKLQEASYGEFQAEMDMINHAFAEVMLEGDAKGRVFTFPIPTFNITADFDWDNPMLEPIWRMTAKYGIPYFSNFINSDMKPEDARSMCPLHPDTPVLVRAGRGIFVRTIKDVYYTNQQKGTEYEILHNGKWLPAKLVASPSAGCLEISLENGARVTMDVRHEQIVKRAKGEPIELITADRIESGMYLPFNATPLTDPADNYEAGFAVGAFLGDGSYDGKGAILYSLNMADKEERVAQRIEAFFVGCGFNVSRHEQKDVVQLVRVGGSGTVAEDWVAQFIEGRNAFEKRIAPRAFQMGSRFLEGLLEGWYQTDGGNRGRIYTVSAGLADDFATLCSLLGKAYCLDRKGDNRNGRYGDSPVFTLKFHNRTSYSTHFFYEDGYWWYPVQHIAPVDYNGLVFCFVVDSPHHLFQLANGLVTHNCRLRLDNRELRKRGGGLFGANPLTGSIGVVTINLPRIGYLARNEADFMNRLARVMDIARTSLEIKRKLLELHTEQGLYPYSRFYLREVKAGQGSYWSNHFSTIGLNGMNEACLNLLGQDIASPEGKAFAIRVLRFMRDRLAEYQEETGTLFNLEATPAEGASYRLAKADRQRYPDIITAGTPEVPYYTNSTHLPVGYTDDIFEALEHQDDLQVLYTGGTVLHGFLGEQIDDWRQARLLVRRIAENFHLPYYTLTPTFSICPVHGYIPGAHPFCPYEHTPEELERYGIETDGEQESEKQI